MRKQNSASKPDIQFGSEHAEETHVTDIKQPNESVKDEKELQREQWKRERKAKRKTIRAKLEKHKNRTKSNRTANKRKESEQNNRAPSQTVKSPAPSPSQTVKSPAPAPSQTVKTQEPAAAPVGEIGSGDGQSVGQAPATM